MRLTAMSIHFIFTFCIYSFTFTCEQAAYPELNKPLLYMPWREAYDKTTKEKLKTIEQLPKKCPFCRMKESENDTGELILARYTYHMIALNLYPYACGHLLIIPFEHVKRLHEMSKKAQHELMWLINQSVEILETIGNADGVNVGINFGKAANASIPDHLHVQLVPRFKNEDAAFLQIIGEAKLVFWDMNILYQEFQQAFQKLKKY